MLGDRRRMSVAQIRRLFENVHSYYQQFASPVHIQFQWHGGEPLLIPPQEYRTIFDIQRHVFASSIHKVTNGIQSNFTVIDDERIALLRDHVDTVGVSLDLFTGLRVNQRGVDQEERALVNVERVRAAGVPLSGITVLSRPNLAHIQKIYRFYRERGMPFRLLPLEKGLYDADGLAISPRELLAALCELADLWLEDTAPIAVAPIRRYFALALFAHLNPANRVAVYDKAKWISVFLVDTDGSVYSYGDRFDQARSAGNVFEAPLGRLLTSASFRATAAEARARMATCDGCAYFGRACPGDAIGESQQDFIEQAHDGTLRCVVAYGLIRHLQQSLQDGRVAPARVTAALSALQAAEVA